MPEIVRQPQPFGFLWPGYRFGIVAGRCNHTALAPPDRHMAGTFNLVRVPAKLCSESLLDANAQREFCSYAAKSGWTYENIFLIRLETGFPQQLGPRSFRHACPGRFAGY
jgi:hypothetical protein